MAAPFAGREVAEPPTHVPFGRRIVRSEGNAQKSMTGPEKRAPAECRKSGRTGNSRSRNELPLSAPGSGRSLLSATEPSGNGSWASLIAGVTTAVEAGLRNTQPHSIYDGMRYYRIIPEANGTFTIYVNEVGTLPGTYTGFKSEAEANSWVAEQQKHPDLPPFLRFGI